MTRSLGFLLSKNAADSFIWGSSEVDWCEENFEVSSFVAEFWNTVSNVFFFVLPPLLMYLFNTYAQRVTWGVHIVWLLLIIVGAGSVCFHATLSLFGQLWDEIAIIWVVMTSLIVWFPSKYLPWIWQKKRQYFTLTMIAVTLLITFLACVMPVLNCMFLFILALPVATLLVAELRICEEPLVVGIGVRSCIIFGIAIASWIVDRFLCDVTAYLGFPYLHCAWHVCICLSSYQVCVLFAYFAAQTRVPELLPVMRIWPGEGFEYCGVPYVTFKTLPTDVKHCAKHM